MLQYIGTLLLVLLLFNQCRNCELHHDDPNTDDFVVQIKENFEAEAIEKLGMFQLYKVKKIVRNFYLFRRQPLFHEGQEDTAFNNQYDITILQNTPGILSIEKQEVLPRTLRATDAEWEDMWYMNGGVTPSMKIEEAWALNKTGKNIHICIIDGGIDVNHPDLKDNMIGGNHHDFIDGDDDPSTGSRNDSHGTQLAGLIGAAKENGHCVVGVAYNASLIAVRLVGGDSLTDDMEADALGHEQNVADIYSNSWGPPDGYGYIGPGQKTEMVLEDGIDNGRGAYGAIYVWSSGSGTKEDNCNGDGYVNSIYTIAIASLGYNQEPAPYSEICAPTFAATYGGSAGHHLVSTTHSGACSSRDLEGTSYAASLASGIIALALESKPTLTWRDVQHLIVFTSKKYEIVDTEYGGWQVNGAGKPFSQRVGFGLMDAEAMVTMAAEWTTVPEWQWCGISQIVNTGVDFKNPVSSTKTVSHCVIHYIEHVRVRVVFEATQRGSVELKFNSPAGSVSYLMTARKGDNQTSTQVNWEFMSVHFWGENADGDWTLEMSLKDENVTGQLTSWDLTIDGSEFDPVPGVDMCSDDPCQNNATCTDLNYAFKCGCLPHYYGDRCQYKTIFCSDGPCQNNGNCTDDPAGYYCNCTDRYTGKNCEIEITTPAPTTTTQTTQTTEDITPTQEQEVSIVVIVAGALGAAVASVTVGVGVAVIVKAKCVTSSVGSAVIQPIP